VPEDKESRLAIMRVHHDSKIAGHQGQARTLELISRRYFWPGMKQSINRYVESCETCQRTKGSKSIVPIKPLGIPKGPWEDIAFDFVVKLPKSRGSDSILVVVDQFSRMAHFIPCKESHTASDLANLFITNVWKLHGFPKSTISD
jgi:hypothetical protein